MSSSIFILASLVLTNAADVADALEKQVRGTPFDVQVTLCTICQPELRSFLAIDRSGSINFMNHDPRWRTQQFDPGDVVHLTGRTETNDLAQIVARVESVVRIGQRPAPRPADTTLTDVKRRRHDHRLVRLRGFVREAFRDEVDHLHFYLVLEDGGDSIYAVLRAAEIDAVQVRGLVNAEIEIVGACHPRPSGFRKLLGMHIFCTDIRKLKVLHAAPADPFAVDPLPSRSVATPEDFARLGRHRLVGTVLAVERQQRLLVVDDAGDLHAVHLADRTPPAPETRIAAVGRPVTDLYRANLADAIWRPETNGTIRPRPAPVSARIRDILTDWAGQPGIKPAFHGQVIRLCGTVLDISRDLNGDLGLVLKSDGLTVPVDASACTDALKDVETGCRVDIAGVCVVETADWNSYSSFPHSTGITLVTGRPDDVTVLARPPWWTPARLLAVIGALLAALVGIFAWNRILRHLVERRSRELLREQVAHATSELRVDERTRLAVELHDSVSQNLTGASLHIGIVRQLFEQNPEKAVRHLDIAARTLDSCRDEMHNCIWDLRNQTLEEADLNDALATALAPCIGNAKLSIRFNVPRTRLSDNTVYALLRIIRELAANAVRHGHATTIRIAGALDDGLLLFSVADDGGGFAVAKAPGIDEGHFGLQGVRERVRELGGTIRIDSAPGSGTRVVVSIAAHGKDPS